MLLLRSACKPRLPRFISICDILAGVQSDTVYLFSTDLNLWSNKFFFSIFFTCSLFNWERMTWDKPFLQVFLTQDKQQQVKRQSKIQKTPSVYKDQYSHLLNLPLACRLAFWSLDFSAEADSPGLTVFERKRKAYSQLTLEGLICCKCGWHRLRLASCCKVTPKLQYRLLRQSVSTN